MIVKNNYLKNCCMCKEGSTCTNVGYYNKYNNLFHKLRLDTQV